MPSEFIITVPCPQYLVNFLETLYGRSPIEFPRSSNFNAILDVFLEKQPASAPSAPVTDQTDHLVIRLPYFENKDVRTYNYLTQVKERILVKELWKFFKITYRGEIAKSICLGLERKDAIALFVDKYNLPLDTWDLLEKDFQRYLKLRHKKKSIKVKKSSSVEGPFCPADSTRGAE